MVIGLLFREPVESELKTDNLIRSFAIFSLLLLAGAQQAQAKEWRGITPLHSTREDVIRLLGEPEESSVIRAKYASETENIYIVFANDQTYFPECLKALPIDTVLLVKVTPKLETRLSDLRVDTNRLVKFNPSDPPNIGYEGYIDEEEGIVIRTFNGRIDEINYITSATDKYLCPRYYKDPKMFVHILVHFQSDFLRQPR